MFWLPAKISAPRKKNPFLLGFFALGAFLRFFLDALYSAHLQDSLHTALAPSSR